MGASCVHAELPRSKSIMVIGSTSEGKSSLINLLVGGEVAPTGDGARGVTFACCDYETNHRGSSYIFSDTVGLNEGDCGTVPHRQALKQLINFATSHKQGFNLFVFVMKKGRITTSFEKNLLIFYTTLFGKQVPCILYVSSCEHYEIMGQWYTANQHAFKPFGFAAAVCGTTLVMVGERDDVMEPLRAQTSNEMWGKIEALSLKKPIPITAIFSVWHRILNIIWEFFTRRPFYEIWQANELKTVLLSRGMKEEDIDEICEKLTYES